MKHRSLDFMYDPHIPNNDPHQVQMALEMLLQEMQDDLQYGGDRPDSERIDRIEAGFMLLAARLTQHGVA